MTCTRPRGLLARLALLSMLTLLAACGGGGGSTTPTTTTPTTPTTPATPALTNLAAVTIDDGPAALGTGANPTRAVDLPYVSVTICVPSTTTCQTIDHIQVDTGSIGLRLLHSVLNANIAAGLPQTTDPSGNPVGECYGFVDGYAFGSVRTADFTIGGETVDSMALQVIGDTGRYATAPASCSAGGGPAITGVSDLTANGILGIGTTPTDCGADCTRPGGYGAAIYYDCPNTGCGTIITRASTKTAPFEQLPNPVAAMSVDNNGSILVLPSQTGTGSLTASGTLYFGIGTQTNNALASSAHILTTTVSTDDAGSGVLTATYNGRSLPASYIDSGSSAFFFQDSSIPPCTDSNDTGYYCPASPLMLTPTLTGTNGVTASAAFTLYNAHSQFAAGNAAVPGIGANPAALSGFSSSPNSFDFGAPFFFGRSIYTAIEGTTAAGTPGPYAAY